MKSRKIFAVITIAAFLLTIIGGQIPVEARDLEMSKVIISFHDFPNQAEEALINNLGGEVNFHYNIIPAMAVSLPERAIAGLSRNPKIKLIETDAKIYLLDAELDNTWGVKHIGAGEVHASGNNGGAIKVAVIDTGVDCSHVELRGNCAGGWNFVSNNNNYADDHGHGTHVAGTIAAIKNNIGVVGTAPEAQIYAYKILDANGSGNMSTVIAALDRAVIDGVQITNNSYGSSGHVQAVQDAFDARTKMIHVAAAGNSGNNRGIGDNVSYPARYDSVIAVAATDKNNRRASFSSTGPDVEISAPGVSILSAYPGNYLATMSGTSMASPHVAGTVALMLKSGTKPEAVRGALRDTAIDLGVTGRDNLYGYGLVNAAAFAGEPAPIENQPPVASAGGPYDAYVNQEIEFDGSGSYDPNGDALTYSWDFGDGTTAEGEGVKPKYTYSGIGNYIVTLTVSDGEFNSIATSSVNIKEYVEQDVVLISAEITDMSLSSRGINYAANVSLFIKDETGKPMEGATVFGEWSGGTSGVVSGTTDANGALSFTSPNMKKPASGTIITFTVTGVTKTSYEWDNNSINRSISIP